MIIKINERLINNAINYATAILPQEACGAWIGNHNREDAELIIQQFVPIPNAARDPLTSFLFEPQKWVQLVYALAQNEHQIIAGIFHSHPTTRAVPSYDDLQTLWSRIPSYWILSLIDQSSPHIHAYQLKKHGLYDEITIIQT